MKPSLLRYGSRGGYCFVLFHNQKPIYSRNCKKFYLMYQNIARKKLVLRYESFGSGILKIKYRIPKNFSYELTSINTSNKRRNAQTISEVYFTYYHLQNIFIPDSVQGFVSIKWTKTPICYLQQMGVLSAIMVFLSLG